MDCLPTPARPRLPAHACLSTAACPCLYSQLLFSNRRIVGSANALSAGWGNSAGGFVQLLMPLLLQARAALPGRGLCLDAAC